MAVLQTIKKLFVPDPEPVEEPIVPAAPTSYAVKRLSLKDIDRLLRLNLRCFKQGENYTRHTFNYLLTQPQSLGLAAETPSGDRTLRGLSHPPRHAKSGPHPGLRHRFTGTDGKPRDRGAGGDRTAASLR